MIHKFSRYLLTLVALLAMTTGAWAEPQEELLTTVTATGQTTSSQSPEGIVTVTLNNINFYTGDYGWLFGGTVTVTAASDDYTITRCVFKQNAKAPLEDDEAPFTATIGEVDDDYFVSAETKTGPVKKDMDGITSIEVYGYKKAAAPEVEVEISTDQQSAEFDMPSYDATLEYEIVRNLASNMTVSIGDGQDGYRIRVKKDGESFVPAEMTLQQMMALYTVHDATEQKDLLFYGDGKVCDISIFAVDDQGQPTGQPIAFTALTPGRYVAIATAPDDSPLYAGQTPQSNIFVLYQGYEVTVPAGEYITYYRDEPLMVDKTQQPYAELYTISEVGTETATLSGPYDAMKTLTPMLVFNSSTDAQTILLIPTTEPDLALTVAPEFKGTLEATEIAASTASTNNYAFNGKQFVWVKTALAVGQYKAWLEVPTGVNARVINLVFGDATKITTTNYTNFTNGDWYDLNGRKLNAIPTKKGVYIMNGKKVVVK